jgi:AcrR family transcriptional regulator
MATDKKQKINYLLKTALRLFAHYGFKKTTLEDVARELGMTKSNLYFYVKNKRDLYEMAVSFAFKEWQSSVAEAVAKVDDVVEKFSVMSKCSFGYLLDHEDLRSVFMKDPGIFTLYPAEDRFYEINLGAIHLIEAILNQGIEQGRFHAMDVKHIAELFFSIYIMFLIKAYVKSEGVSALHMYEEGLSIILRGLCRDNPEVRS